MNTIFMNSKSNKISDLHRLLLNLTDKIDLTWKYRYITYYILAFTIHEKGKKKLYKSSRFKISAGKWNEEL